MDTTAKRVALEPVIWQLLLMPWRPVSSNYSPIYTKEELDKSPKCGFKRDLGGHGCLVNEHGQYFFLPTAACQAIREAHQGTHYRREALYYWLVEVMLAPGMKSNNPNMRGPPIRPIQTRGTYPERTGRLISLSHWEHRAISGIFGASSHIFWVDRSIPR